MRSARFRSLVAPAIVAAVLMSSAAPALASGGEDGDHHGGAGSENTVTEAPETTAAPIATPTSAPRQGESEAAKQLGRLIAKVESSSLPASTKDALLAQLRAARDAAVTGQAPSSSDLEALARAVKTALTSAVGTTPSSSTAPVGDGSTSTSTSKPRTTKPVDLTKLNAQLDEWIRKVEASSLSDADKATLLAAIDHVRTTAAAGTLVPADIDLVRGLVKQALESHHENDDHDTTSTIAADGSTTTITGTDDTVGSNSEGRHAGAAKRLDHAIEAVTRSTLPEALKQELLAVLEQAKSTIADPTLTPDQVREKLHEIAETEKAQRIQRAGDRLRGYSVKLGDLAALAAAIPGSETVVAEARDKIAQADALLAGTLDVPTLKAAWRLLHDARKGLGQLLESAAGSTTIA